jgi:flagellar motor switch protein FliN
MSIVETQDNDGRTGPVAEILGEWAGSLAQVLEGMADQRPEISWRELHGTIAELGLTSAGGSDDTIAWWEQPFDFSPDAQVWVGTPKPVWEYTGTITLRAAGLESVEAEEARNTWFEILGQSLSSMARAIGLRIGHEAKCDAGVERPPATEVREWVSVSLSFSGKALPPLLLHLHPKLISHILSPSRLGRVRPSETSGETSPGAHGLQAPAKSRTMDLLMDVDLPVSISFGKARLPLRDVLKLTTGSIVELNRAIDEPVEILVNERLVARGEVIVLDGNYGVRIQEIVAPQDRLQRIR